MSTSEVRYKDMTPEQRRAYKTAKMQKYRASQPKSRRPRGKSSTYVIKSARVAPDVLAAFENTVHALRGEPHYLTEAEAITQALREWTTQQEQLHNNGKFFPKM